MIKQYCKKCFHEWIPRTEKPQRCPRCGKWQQPKKSEKKNENKS